MTDYDVDAAARDAILIQTGDKKLQQKILSEDLNYANMVKYGLSLEQGKKVEEIISSQGRPEDTRVAQLEEEVRKLGKQLEPKDRSKQHNRKRVSRSLMQHLYQVNSTKEHAQGKR